MAAAADRIQWLPRAALLDHQNLALIGLLLHARATVPFYRNRLSAVLDDDGNLRRQGWPDVPFLTRQDAQNHLNDLQTTDLPDGHGGLVPFCSSGTTGNPVHGHSTFLGALRSEIMQVRARTALGVDLSLTRAQVLPDDERARRAYPGIQMPMSWAPMWEEGSTSGAWFQLDHVTPHKQQLDWLCERGRCYLAAMPNSVKRLAELVLDGAAKPDIAAVMTFGEVTNDDVRDLVRRGLGCEIWNNYVMEEAGCIAYQCPTGTHMHICEDNVLVEILDRDMQPCAPGQPGEVIITALYNYQMPIIRYRTGDIAVPGELCDCGRGLAVMQSVAGRNREVFYFGNGDSFIPGIQSVIFLTFLRAKSYQIAQTHPDTIEIRFVSDVVPEQNDLDGFVAAACSRLPDGLKFAFRQMDHIPGADSAKFSYQVCELPDHMRHGPPTRLAPALD